MKRYGAIIEVQLEKSAERIMLYTTTLEPSGELRWSALTQGVSLKAQRVSLKAQEVLFKAQRILFEAQRILFEAQEVSL